MSSILEKSFLKTVLWSTVEIVPLASRRKPPCVSSLGPILLGDEFQQILDLQHNVVEEGLAVINAREMFGQDRRGGVTRTSLPTKGVEGRLFARTWIVPKIG